MTSRRRQIEEALRTLAPRIPDHEAMAVLDHAEDSRGLSKAQPPTAAWLSLVAYVRHVHTDYDGLLGDGYDADSARFFVLDEINAALAEWGCRRQVSGEDDEGAGPSPA